MTENQLIILTTYHQLISKILFENAPIQFISVTNYKDLSITNQGRNKKKHQCFTVLTA